MDGVRPLCVRPIDTREPALSGHLVMNEPSAHDGTMEVLRLHEGEAVPPEDLAPESALRGDSLRADAEGLVLTPHPQEGRPRPSASSVSSASDSSAATSG